VTDDRVYRRSRLFTLTTVVIAVLFVAGATEFTLRLSRDRLSAMSLALEMTALLGLLWLLPWELLWAPREVILRSNGTLLLRARLRQREIQVDDIERMHLAAGAGLWIRHHPGTTLVPGLADGHDLVRRVHEINPAVKIGRR
jgi:hypothetical protein